MIENSFEFFSEGPKGKIKKRVLFSPFRRNSRIYNLAFGDVDDKDEINDLVVSNNLDKLKVLYTVVECALQFFELYPSALLYIQGSTENRTRLYRMGITFNWATFEKAYDVYGYHNEWKRIELGSKCDAFLIGRKNL